MEDLAPHVLSEAGEIGFELDRFELLDGRLELTGRWFGVQGRRFMRPSLTVRADDGETRLLADLAHKPWVAENGELWQAAFPCDGELDAKNDAELTVAPDLTVVLRVPHAARTSRSTRKRNRETRRKPRREDDKRDGVRRLTAPVPHSSIAQRDAHAEQTRALGSARAEIATLRERLETIGEELESDRTRLAGELRHAQRTATDAVRDRDEANAARRKERDSREIALQTIEQALVARDKARRAAESALAERDNAVARLEEALGQRDRAVARRDQAAAERDQAAKELERVTDKRGELARANEQLRHQHETAVPSRGAVPMMRNAAVDSSTERRQVQRLAAAIPIASLLVVALAVILILSSH